MSFKAHVQSDIKDTFLNLSEFSDLQDFAYNGTHYKIPIAVDSDVTDDRKILVDDFGEGVVQIDLILYVSLDDLGLVPEKDVSVEFEQERFVIQRVDNEYGMLAIYLRRRSQ